MKSGTMATYIIFCRQMQIATLGSALMTQFTPSYTVFQFVKICAAFLSQEAPSSRVAPTAGSDDDEDDDASSCSSGDQDEGSRTLFVISSLAMFGCIQDLQFNNRPCISLHGSAMFCYVLLLSSLFCLQGFLYVPVCQTASHQASLGHIAQGDPRCYRAYHPHLTIAICT